MLKHRLEGVDEMILESEGRGELLPSLKVVRERY
jgi:hypothetical protein